MTANEHLLSCLAEECAEINEACAKVAIRVSKALRFGLDEIQLGQVATNAQRIAVELADLAAVIEVLEQAGVIPSYAKTAKSLKLAAFMAYAQEYGSLSVPHYSERERDVVGFTYTNHRGETSRRHVIPLRIRSGETQWHPGEQCLLEAFDLDKKMFRTFALKDIRWDEPSASSPREAEGHEQTQSTEPTPK